MKGEKKFSKIQELVYELKVGDVMKREVITVHPDTPMSEFREVLRYRNISGTPVVEGDRLIGIISIEDLIGWLTNCREDFPLRNRMSTNVITVYNDDPLVTAVSKLEQYGYGRLPVLDRKTSKLVGIVTKGVIIEGLLRELEIDYHEEEIHRYRASHIFEDITAHETELIIRYSITGREFEKGGEAASGVKKTLKRLKIAPDICRRAAIAAYEAEMNVIFYTDGGNMQVIVRPDIIHIDVSDHGPGIPDIKKALEPGFSTAPEWIRELGFGAGMGLNNIQSCADEMNISSVINEGTRLIIKIFLKKDETERRN